MVWMCGGGEGDGGGGQGVIMCVCVLRLILRVGKENRIVRVGKENLYLGGLFIGFGRNF